jgi:chromosome segregation ATPase
MATFLKHLRRGGTREDSAELQSLALRLEAQHASLTELVQRAERTIGQLQRLGTLGERVSAMERKTAGLEQLTARIEAAEQRLVAISQGQDRLDVQAGATKSDLERSRTEVTALSDAVATAQRVKEELGQFTALDEPFQRLRGELDGVAALAEKARTELGRLQAQQDQVGEGQRIAASRLEGLDAEWHRLTRTFGETEHRIAGLEQLLADFAPVAEGVQRTRRELAGAKAVTDQLSQKVSLLEQQREAIDRATGKLEHLTGLMRRADAGVERQADLARGVSELQARVESADHTQRAVHDRAQALAERMGSLESGQANAQRAFDLLKSELEQAVERLALESRGLDGLSQRGTDLRRELAAWEERMEALGERIQLFAGAAAKADAIATQVGQLGGELAQLGELPSRVRAGLSDLERLEAAIEGLTERTCRVEEARPTLDRVVRDLASLGATSEAIGEALDQLRDAREELTRTRTAMEGTGAWLSDTGKAMAGLRENVAGVDRMRATVDRVRQELDQVNGTMNLIESRRTLVEDVQRRLAEAQGVGAVAEERAQGLAQRLESAEEHLGTLVPRLDEVGRASSQLLSLGADLRDLEQRLGALQGSVKGVEERADGMEQLAERMQGLSREIDQRQHALQRALEHLDRATALRRDAAAAADTLATRVREADTSLAQAGERLSTLENLAEELDSRIATLQGAQERIAGFEARLAEWRTAEAQLQQAMEQVVGRQAAISALQTEIRSLYEMAERTQADARAVSEAQPQVAETRAQLEALLVRLGDAGGTLRTLEERRRQLDRAEERLAHTDTLVSDIRGALEILLAQKAQVDHFLEQAGALALEAKHVEALLGTLREERRLADRIRSSLASLQRHEATDEPAEAAAAG